MSAAIKVFPFQIVNRFTAQDLFSAYLAKFRDQITAEHGSTYYVGRSESTPTGYKRMWSYYDVDVKLIDECTVEFQTYDMACSVNGGRGRAQEKFVHTFKSPSALAKHVELRKRQIAEQVLDRRRAEEAERRRQAEIDAVYQELFADTGDVARPVEAAGAA